VTVVPLRARNFRYFYSITPAGGRGDSSRGISIEFQTIFKLHLIWLAIDGCARACVWEREKKRKRGKADRDNPRVYALDADVRVRFQVGSRPRAEYYRLYDSLKRHDIYKQSIVCFARSMPRGKTEARYNNHVSLVCKQNYEPVANVTHQFFEKGEEMSYRCYDYLTPTETCY